MAKKTDADHARAWRRRNGMKPHKRADKGTLQAAFNLQSDGLKMAEIEKVDPKACEKLREYNRAAARRKRANDKLKAAADAPKHLANISDDGKRFWADCTVCEWSGPRRLKRESAEVDLVKHLK